MTLERLAPLVQEGGEPARGVAPKKAPKKARGKARGKPRYPSRDERAAAAAHKEQARADEVAADPEGYARQACLQLLEHGPRTRRELEQALAKKGVPSAAADTVLGRFADVGIIDDALFASLWVSSRHRGRGLAGRALSQELRRKGIDDEVAKEALAQLDPDEEAQTARGLVRRKLGSTRGLPKEARVRRLAGMLARKGYGPGLAFRIVKEELERDGSLDLDDLDALPD